MTKILLLLSISILFLFPLYSFKKNIDTQRLIDEMMVCLEVKILTDRHGCFYRFTDKMIVLKNNEKVSLKELKSIFKQMFFSEKNQFNNKTYKIAQFINKKPIKTTINIINPDNFKNLEKIAYKYLEKSRFYIKFFHRSIDVEFASPGNQIPDFYIGISDNKNYENDIIILAKSLNYSPYVLIKRKGEGSLVVNIINEKNYLIENTFSIVNTDKNSDTDNIFKLYLMHFGFPNKNFILNNTDVTSVFNESCKCENLSFTFLDALLLAIWYHPDIAEGVSEEKFYQLLEEIVMSDKK